MSPTSPAGAVTDGPSPTTPTAALSRHRRHQSHHRRRRAPGVVRQALRPARAALAAGAGHARLPASVWVVDPAEWRPGFVAAQVDLMATSPTLAVTHSLVVRTVRFDPPVLPTPPGTPAGTAVVSPTSRLGVTAVVANQGSVAEPHAVVHVTLADAASPSGSTRTWTGSVPSGRSVAVPTVGLRRQARHDICPHRVGGVPAEPGRRCRRYVPGHAASLTRHLSDGPGRTCRPSAGVAIGSGLTPSQERAPSRGREHHDYRQPQRRVH